MDQKQKLLIRLKRVVAYNKQRIERGLCLMAPKQRPLFHVLPFLLHVNHKDLPGYVDNPKVPFGFPNFSLKEELTQSLNTVFPDKTEIFSNMKAIWPKVRKLDSLLLMGSIGSIGQSEKSDFDYWVCVNQKKLGDGGWDLLQEKLTKVEKWADENFGLEVHFFLSDIQKVKRNDFGEAGGESAGSAQATLLKAEFYATNILVAGKEPFWWVAPDTANDEFYGKLLRFAASLDKPDPRLFMDLGNLDRIIPEEMFGAAIWQISKAMDSPFKSVIKMAKLEVFIENVGKEQPLCNILKRRVHIGPKSDEDLKYADPYALMFDQVVEYYEKLGKPDTVKLMQTCLYIKSDCKLSEPPGDADVHFKRDIISQYITDWGWDIKKLEHLDAIKNWDFKEVSELGQEIHSYLIACYRRLSAKIQQQEQLVSNADATVIGRKIDSFYTKKDNKIVYLKRAFEEGLYVNELSVIAKMDLNSPGKKSWAAYRGNVINWQEHEIEHLFLKKSNDPVDLILWCVFNRIVDNDTLVSLSPKCEPLTIDDFKGFIDQAIHLFPPIKISELTRDVLMAPERITRCLIVINFESWRNNANLETVRTVYATSWGELYSVAGFDTLQEMEAQLQDAIGWQEVYVLAPFGQHKQKLYDEFVEATGMEYVQFL